MVVILVLDCRMVHLWLKQNKRDTQCVLCWMLIGITRRWAGIPHQTQREAEEKFHPFERAAFGAGEDRRCVFIAVRHQPRGINGQFMPMWLYRCCSDTQARILEADIWALMDKSQHDEVLIQYYLLFLVQCSLWEKGNEKKATKAFAEDTFRVARSRNEFSLSLFFPFTLENAFHTNFGCAIIVLRGLTMSE